MDDIPQPGSLEAEAGVFCSTFDMTGTRLITGGADKTIKVSFNISPPCPIRLTIFFCPLLRCTLSSRSNLDICTLLRMSDAYPVTRSNMYLYLPTNAHFLWRCDCCCCSTGT